MFTSPSNGGQCSVWPYAGVSSGGLASGARRSRSSAAAAGLPTPSPAEARSRTTAEGRPVAGRRHAGFERPPRREAQTWRGQLPRACEDAPG